MRYSKTLKLVATSMIASAILVGCSGTANGTDTITNSGVAIDPELQGATVFLDVNENGLFDSGEPSTTTDDLGNYSLTMDSNQVGAPIIVIGGIDRVTKEEFTGKLSVISENGNANLHITPLTTLVHQTKLANPNKDIDTIKSDLAIQLNINTDDIDKNIVESGNEALLQIALRVQKMAQGIVDSNSTNTTIQNVYADIASELESTDLETALVNACDTNIPDTDFENAKLKDLEHELSLLDDAGLTAEQLALSMENLDNNVSAAKTQGELDVDIYDDADMIISNDTEVQAQRQERTFQALGLNDLNATQKDEIITQMGNAGIDFEEGSLDDIVTTMMSTDFGYTWDTNQTAMFQEMLTRYDTMGSDYETEMMDNDDNMSSDDNNMSDDDMNTSSDMNTTF